MGMEKRYLIAFLGAFTVLSGLVLAVTLVIDPYGISPFKVNIEGVNAARVERMRLDRMIKPLDVLNRKPKTLFIGTSRVKEGIDPDSFTGTRFAPVYNLGIDFSSLTESVSLLETLLPHNPQVKYVFLELNFIHFYGPGPVRVATNTRELVLDTATAAFSTDALIASISTALKNSFYFGHGYWLEDNGLVNLPPMTMMGDLENFFNSVVSKVGNLEISTVQIDFSERISSICTRHKVQCAYVILPYQPVDLAHLKLGGGWEAIEQVKRFSMTYLPTWDFTLYNSITNEPLKEGMSYWIDVNHFTPKVGGYIAKRLLGQRAPEIPENFGVLLSPENIETTLSDWRKGRDLWLAANPDLVKRIEAGIRNKQ
ncbi:hypothetical protein [Magnetovibrio sp.]|uniref:hypothetical protein n=1 Tax=Magnetovibrio sp. TaxID=2024836 RepID=UPI002F941124